MLGQRTIPRRSRTLVLGLLACLIAWLTGSLALGCGSASSPKVALSQIQQIRALSAPQLRQGHPVTLEGVITYFDPHAHLMVIQDDTGGIAIEQQAPLGSIAAGDRIRLQGFTAWEAFAPVVVKARVQRLGTEPLPRCVPATAVEALSPRFQERRVELVGKVETAHAIENRRFELQVRQGEQQFRVAGNFILKMPIVDLPGQEVRVCGVPMVSHSPEGKPYDLTLYGGSPEDVQFNAPRPSRPSAPEANDQVSSQPFTAIWALKSLPGEAAAKGYPARLKGVVTSCTGLSLTLQDDTAAIYVFPVPPNQPSVSPGTRVEIEGHSASGEFAPILRPDKIRVLGSGPLPPLLHPDPGEGFSGREENRWAEVEGVVHQGFVDSQHASRIQLSMGSSTILVTFSVPIPEANLEGLVDCRVRVRGIYQAIQSEDHRLLGLTLHAQDLDNLEILEKPSSRGFFKPTQSIHSLTEYDPQGLPVHQVKVQGWITHVSSDGTLHLSDGSGGIRISPARGGDFQIGQVVAAVGFLGSRPTKPSLQSAQVQVLSSRPEPTPPIVPVDTALAGIFDGQVIQVDGFLRQRTIAYGNHILSLQSGRTRVTAILEHPQPFPLEDQLRPEALVRLTGVCDVQWDARTTPPLPTEVKLLLRRPEDLQILRPAPWWTLHKLLILMAFLAGILLIVVLRTVHLYRRVIQRTVELRSQVEKREELEAQLRQSQKLEGIGRLAGGVAHDFNNLLTIINGYCDLMLTELPQGSELWESTGHMRKAGEHAAILTRQLLAFSRKQVLKPTVLDLNRHLAEMERMMVRLIPTYIEFSIQPCPESCLIKVDPSQIDQVIMNLALNARDAMPEGGRIELRTQHVMQPNATESHPEVLPGPYVELTVQDTGHGMPPEVLQQIFEPFFTTKAMGKGTGLGLSTVFGIVKQSGGHIWASSKPGQGSSFRMIFPCTNEAPSVAEPTPVGPLLGHGERVLVVEDEVEVRALVARSLEAKGFEVLVAESPEDALEIADTYPQAIDLLLTDVIMPGMSGRDVARLVQQRHPLIHVLFMSGFAEEVIASKGALEEGIEFLQKPFTDQELVAKVLNAINRRI